MIPSLIALPARLVGAQRKALGQVFVEAAKLTAFDGGTLDNFGFAVAISGDIVAVGAPSDDNQQGAVYVFERNRGGTDNWGLVKKITGSNPVNGDKFGIAVALDGDVIVIGARFRDVGSNVDQGAAFVFERNQGGTDNWGEIKEITAADGAAGDEFGISTDVSGNRVIVGAWNKEAAYIFERDQGGTDNWGQVAKLTATDSVSGDKFGRSVGISGDVAIVGAFKDDVFGDLDRGSAYLFDRNQGGAGSWGEVKKFEMAGGTSGDWVGVSVAIDGDVVVVGASAADIGSNSNQGTIYIAERNEGGTGNWGLVTQQTASNGAAGDGFGRFVSVSGNLILAGAWWDDVGSIVDQGSVYVYEQDLGGTSKWGESQEITASDGETGDDFGNAVGISGDVLVAGAPGEDDNGSDAGAAYIFQPPITPTPTPTPTNTPWPTNTPGPSPTPWPESRFMPFIANDS